MLVVKILCGLCAYSANDTRNIWRTTGLKILNTDVFIKGIFTRQKKVKLEWTKNEKKYIITSEKAAKKSA